MLFTRCTSAFCWPFSMRLSLLGDESSLGAASSSVKPACSRIARNLRARMRRLIDAPFRSAPMRLRIRLVADRGIENDADEIPTRREPCRGSGKPHCCPVRP
jgi:hypothetical protein